jgi:serine/threonine protein kinase
MRFHDEIRKAAFSESHSAVKSHVVCAVDAFVVEGPNGRHRCLVLEPMSCNAFEYITYTPLSGNEGYEYNYTNVRSMLKDLLLGLHEMHSRGIAHGDPHAKHLVSELPLSIDLKDEAT